MAGRPGADAMFALEYMARSTACLALDPPLLEMDGRPPGGPARIRSKRLQKQCNNKKKHGEQKKQESEKQSVG